MGDSLDDKTFSWSDLVDAVAGPLRLEPPARRAFGHLATLHLVATIWGEIALLRSAERFVKLHHVVPDELFEPPPPGTDPAWFASFLAQLPREEPAVPLPAALLRPAAPALAP
jgi:hypothetical protein